MKENKENCLFQLQKWYVSQCDGEWKHEFGVSIGTIDNPGWSIRIDLANTPLENKEFEDVRIDITEGDWILCWVKDKLFQGGSGPQNLVDLIKTFLFWNDKFALSSQHSPITDDSNLLELQKWYQSQCNGDWEHEFGITIETVDNRGWYVTINLKDTNLEDAVFEEIKEEKNDLNWYFCLIRDNNFEASCSPFNLNSIFHVFLQWAENVRTRSRGKGRV